MDYRSLSDCVSTLKGVSGAAAAIFELSVEGAIARLTLDRPATRNALRLDDWRVLVALVEQAARMRARVLLIESKVPGTFCAGADLNELALLHADPTARLPFRNAMRAALDGIRRSPLPVIAAIDGACVGAGLALASACDLRVVGPKARFALPSARLGMGYPVEDIARLRALVGEGQAARLLLTAAEIDADEAIRIGLAQMAGTDALALARQVAGNGPAALAMLKNGLLLAASGVAVHEGHDRAFDAAFGGAEFEQGYSAAREGRLPAFGP
jgi:enoyl-CoA hydratase/carnithine racemase